MTDFNQTRAIIWCAVSSKPQAAEEKASLPEQEAELRAAAERLGLRIVDVLIVDGHSRRYFNFPEFVEAAAVEGIDAPARLMEHWKRRDFDVFLCKDGSRFGRRQSIFGEVVERTIDAGAKLFTLQDGWIDSSNHHMFISMAGYAAASHMTRLIHDQQAAFKKRASRGLPHGPVPALSHKLVRDEQTGKGLRLVPDESHRRLLEDAARLLLDGVAWHQIENRLNEMGHRINNAPVKPNIIYRLFHNPVFWGHTASGHNRKTARLERGIWVYDPSEPAPEHVSIFRDTHQSFLTGDLAESVRAEMRRRAQIRGNARPSETCKFTGLVACGHCLCTMTHLENNTGRHYWRCQSIYFARREPRCTVSRSIREQDIINWLSQRLFMMRETGDAYFFARDANAPDYAARAAQLAAEIETAESSARTLVIKQATAPAALGTIYDEQLVLIGGQLEALRRELAQTEYQLAAQRTAEVRSAFEHLKTYESVADFWKESNTFINQFLHRLFGRNKLVVKDGEVIGLAPVPRRW